MPFVKQLIARTVKPVYAPVRARVARSVYARGAILETDGEIQLEELELAGPHRVRYKPACWSILPRILPAHEVSDEDVFIDYGSGNLHSAAKAFERAARSAENPQTIMVTSDPEAVYRADRIVLPGVGAFADCRRGLDALDGMVEALTEAVRDKARPFFGICVGMQLMASRGKEHVTTDGFNWIEGDVVKITPRESRPEAIQGIWSYSPSQVAMPP